MEKLSRKQMKEVQAGTSSDCFTQVVCVMNGMSYPQSVCCDGGVGEAIVWCRDNGYGSGPHECHVLP